MKAPAALVVASYVALGIARALPDAGVGLWLRLNAATLVLLLPGWAVARAIGLRGLAAALVWSLTLVGLALAFVFATHTTLAPVLWILLGAFLLGSPFALGKSRPHSTRLGLVRLAVVLVGLLIGVAIWFVAGVPWGDQLFHIGRIEKLDTLGSLSLHRVDEFRDGGLHPGYAFPLWHGFLAIVARLTGASPAAVVLHEPSALAPLAALIAYEAGAALFRLRSLAVGFMFASLVPIAFAAGRGGSFVSLGEPGAAAKQLLVPAVIALFFRSLPRTRPAELITLSAGSAALALIHPPYALFLLLVLAGFTLVRLLVRTGDSGHLLPPLALSTLAVGAAFLWLRPIARMSIAFRPTATERARELARYGHELVVSNPHRFALSPELFARTGAFAVAALALLPLTALATPRRWGSFVLGGSLPLFALLLFKPLFPHFAALVSLSQARRAAGFVLLPYAFVGAMAILGGQLGLAAIALALVAGIVLQRAFPGDFSAVFHADTPAWPVWIAFIGATSMMLLVRVAPHLRLKLNGVIATGATIAFLIPIVVHGFSHWTPVSSSDPYALSPGLTSALDRRLPRGAVVFSDINTSYRISAYTPVYVVAAPPAHVADTKANAPKRRLRDVLAFYRNGNLAIPRHDHAQWIVIDRSRPHPRVRLPIVYADRRFVLFRIPARDAF